MKDEEIKKSFAYIQKMRKKINNEDVIGRLEFPKLGIDHVLVNRHDNKEYLNLDPKKNELYTGSIFLNKENKDDFTDFNSRIYGHRILDVSYFVAFNKFFNQDFVDEGNNYFKLTTIRGVLYYDIVAVLDINKRQIIYLHKQKKSF